MGNITDTLAAASAIVLKHKLSLKVEASQSAVVLKMSN